MEVGDNKDDSILTFIDRLIDVATNACSARGHIVLQEDAFSNDGFDVSIASDAAIGDHNEDFVAMFRSGKHPHEIAVAIADGVGSSLLAAMAAKLACLVALRSLAQSETFDDAKPILAVQRVFGFLGKRLKGVDAERAPRGLDASTWESAIQCREILQTTLTVIWTQNRNVKALSLADGGIVGGKSEDAMQFASLSKSCIGVGPFQPRLEPRAMLLEDINYFGAFTDGLNELAEGNQHVRWLLGGGDDLNARQAIDQVLREFPEYIEDNISLCQVRRIND